MHQGRDSAGNPAVFSCFALWIREGGGGVFLILALLRIPVYGGQTEPGGSSNKFLRF